MVLMELQGLFSMSLIIITSRGLTFMVTVSLIVVLVCCSRQIGVSKLALTLSVSIVLLCSSSISLSFIPRPLFASKISLIGT